MKDMFYNYENHLDKKEYPRPLCFPEANRILESENNIEIVEDIKGNEIGVKVRHNIPFTLYFSMCGNVDGEPITELVYNSMINFQILDYKHNVIIEKTLSPDDVYLEKANSIEIAISLDDAQKLKAECYGMNLALSWPGGGYELFSERNGKLIIR